MAKKKVIAVCIALLILAMAIFAIYQLTSSTVDVTDCTEERAPANWTVVLYFAGDNNLADFKQFLFNLHCLEKVGSTDQVHFISLIDRNQDGDSQVFYVEEGNLTEINLTEVNGNWTDEVNMGDPDVLVDFTSYCIDNYPARYYDVKLANHGGGWRGVCWDDTSGGDMLDLPELEDAFTRISEKLGRKVDMVSTEACLVGMAEFAYQLRNVADFYVGSEAYSFGGEEYDDKDDVEGNWIYDRVYGRLKDDPGMTPEEFGNAVIEEFNPYGPWSAPPFIPKTQSSDTLAVYNLSHMDDLKVAVDTLAKKLVDKVSGLGAMVNREAVTKAVGQSDTPESMNTESFSGMLDFIGISVYTNYDLYDFCNRLQQSVILNVDTEAQAVKDCVEQVITAEYHGTNSGEGEHPDAHGIAIYLPYRNTEYNAAYEEIAWAKDTQWDEFFKEYWILPG